LRGVFHKSLTVLVCYRTYTSTFSLGRFAPPVFSQHYQAGLLCATEEAPSTSLRGYYALWHRYSTRISRGFGRATLTGSPYISRTPVRTWGFRDGLFGFHSQLVTESLLISFASLIYMLKFRECIRGAGVGIDGFCGRRTQSVPLAKYRRCSPNPAGDTVLGPESTDGLAFGKRIGFSRWVFFPRAGFLLPPEYVSHRLNARGLRRERPWRTPPPPGRSLR